MLIEQVRLAGRLNQFTSLTDHLVLFSSYSDYTLTYLNRSLNEYVPLKSDWDLENAYLGNAKPQLEIRVQKISVSNLTDWDIVSSSDLNRVASYAGKQTSQLANNFLNKVNASTIFPSLLHLSVAYGL